MVHEGEQSQDLPLEEQTLDELWAIIDREFHAAKRISLKVDSLKQSPEARQKRSLILMIKGFRASQEPVTVYASLPDKSPPPGGTPEQRAQGFDRAQRFMTEELSATAIEHYAESNGLTVDAAKKELRRRMAEHFTQDAF